MPWKVAFWGRDGDKYGKGGRFFFSPRKKMKMSFPERTGPYHHPSLTCTHTGRLTKVPEEPSSAKGSFDTENKLRPKVTEPEHGEQSGPVCRQRRQVRRQSQGGSATHPSRNCFFCFQHCFGSQIWTCRASRPAPGRCGCTTNSSSSVSYFGEK